MTAPVIKRCACKRTYTAKQWQALPGKYVWDEMGLELRQCPCGSHISIELPEEKKEAV